jgi:hypothetical protein
MCILIKCECSKEHICHLHKKKTLTNKNNNKRMNSVPLSPAAATIFFVKHSFSDSTVILPMYTFHVGTRAFTSRADRCLAFLCPLCVAAGNNKIDGAFQCFGVEPHWGVTNCRNACIWCPIDIWLCPVLSGHFYFVM